MRYKSSLNYTTYIYQYIEINTYMCGFFSFVRVITYIISYIELSPLILYMNVSIIFLCSPPTAGEQKYVHLS